MNVRPIAIITTTAGGYGRADWKTGVRLAEEAGCCANQTRPATTFAITIPSSTSVIAMLERPVALPPREFTAMKTARTMRDSPLMTKDCSPADRPARGYPGWARKYTAKYPKLTV